MGFAKDMATFWTLVPPKVPAFKRGVLILTSPRMVFGQEADALPA